MRLIIWLLDFHWQLLLKISLLLAAGGYLNFNTPIRIEDTYSGVYPPLSRSIDLLTDPGLKSHWITFSRLD
jgi:hypothetical protein